MKTLVKWIIGMRGIIGHGQGRPTPPFVSNALSRFSYSALLPESIL